MATKTTETTDPAPPVALGTMDFPAPYVGCQTAEEIERRRREIDLSLAVQFGFVDVRRALTLRAAL